ncbi:MAG: hypothetical protein U0R70_06320 [Solirubrobacteraceae bacterium]
MLLAHLEREGDRVVLGGDVLVGAGRHPGAAPRFGNGEHGSAVIGEAEGWAEEAAGEQLDRALEERPARGAEDGVARGPGNVPWVPGRSRADVQLGVGVGDVLLEDLLDRTGLRAGREIADEQLRGGAGAVPDDDRAAFGRDLDRGVLAGTEIHRRAGGGRGRHDQKHDEDDQERDGGTV